MLVTIIKAELVILLIAGIWAMISGGSLAGALTGFILFLLIPLVPLVIVLSLIRMKALLGDEYNRLVVLAVMANWAGLIFMIVNVTN